MGAEPQTCEPYGGELRNNSAYSSVTQRQSGRLLTDWLQVRILPGEP